MKQHNMVNSPNHYAGQDGVDIECIDAIHAQLGYDGFLAYCQGNIAKYLWRWKSKGGLQDLQKASKYLGWMIEEVDLEISADGLAKKHLDQMAEEVPPARYIYAAHIAFRLDAFSQEFDYYNYTDFVDDASQNIEQITKHFVDGELIDSYIEGLQSFADDEGIASQQAKDLIVDINVFKKAFM